MMPRLHRSCLFLIILAAVAQTARTLQARQNADSVKRIMRATVTPRSVMAAPGAESVGGDPTPASSESATSTSRDARDELPYHLEVITPPTRKLGVFPLDAQTSIGDVVKHQGTHYEIRSVRCHHRFRGGSFVVTKKEAAVVEATRAKTERRLMRAVMAS